MGYPKNALKFSSLSKQTAGPAAIGGSHTIFKAKVIDQGVEKTGFFKELDPVHFPELLAKISVATSVIKRIFQGERAAEERLVTDDEGKIVGVFSFTLEGFEPFHYSSEGIPSDPNLKERVVPSTATLVKRNIMEILLGRVILYDDDGHPHNIGLVGDLDHDMFWYWFTIYMKDPRPVVGVPNSMFNFTVPDWEDFPRTRDAKIFHHAANNYPGEFSLWTPGIINTYLPKNFADPTQFQQLANNPEAKEQQFAAGLKFLLTYQPDQLRKHLEDAFGNIPLDYTSLDVKLRAIYEEKFPDLCNQTTNTDSFVNFMMKLYQIHYDNLYRVMVFYMGCERNLSREANMVGIPLPATYTALYQKPSFFRTIEEWIKGQNKRLESEKKMKYDEAELKERYHQVWRDSHTKAWDELLQNCYSLCRHLEEKACNDKIVKGEILGKKVTDSISSARELFASVPVLSKDDIDSKILLDDTNGYGKALRELLPFTLQFHSILQNYYSKDCYSKDKNNLTGKDNSVFVSELQQLLANEEAIRDVLPYNTTPANEFARIIANLRQLATQVNFRVHLSSTDEQMKVARMQIVPKELLPIGSSEVINQFINSLFMWAKSISSDLFVSYFNEIFINYNKGSTFGSRYREPEVRKYLNESTNLTNDQRLAFILSSGTSEDGALNTEIIKFFAPLLIQKHSNPSVAKAIREKTFSSEIVKRYTVETVNFAKTDKQFPNLYNKEGIRLFYDALFSWANQLSQEGFDGLIKSALDEYKNSLSRFRLAPTRIPEINRYLNSTPRWSQDKILAYIFLEPSGKDDSTLCSTVFAKLVSVMKKKQGPRPDSIGCQLVNEFDAKKYPEVYANIKEFCREISHKPDPKPQSMPAAASF